MFRESGYAFREIISGLPERGKGPGVRSASFGTAELGSPDTATSYAKTYLGYART